MSYAGQPFLMGDLIHMQWKEVSVIRKTALFDG